MGNKQIKGGGARKYSRNKVWCANYKSQQQRERNKALKLARHIRATPWDKVARAALSKLPQAFQKGLNLPPLCLSPSADRAAKGLTLAGNAASLKAA